MSLPTAWPARQDALRLPLLRNPGTDRIGIGHAFVDNCSFEQACAAITAHASSGEKSAHVITPNAQHIVLLNRDSRFREIYDNADLVVADGISLLFAARLHGRLFQERIAGVDVFRDLCRRAEARGLRIFLLGGRPGSADLAMQALQHKHPELQCSTYCPPYGFESDPAELERVALAIRRRQPHLLFVGLGAPKQEYWIHEHGLRLGVPVCIGVGGSFELVGGVTARAPVWVQRIACEWLFRVAQEPRRLWRRYLIGNLEFAEIVLRQRGRRLVLDTCVRLAAEHKFGAELKEVLLQNEVSDQMLKIFPYSAPTGTHDFSAH